ncbi:MAG: 50S ribosomal protein L19e [Thaumarchaeota archaeon]|nr:MAG: 50S ribosomal protein L19e [Nitrososphaerota archaeon]RLG04788.1 MAG: 50S ribosomal protein L19e [Nitrososphaerota archaeon]HDD43191.1 50S ribosomal protein L19e [Nitrososphaeria archaeon]
MGLKLTFQRRLAADLLKCGIHRVKLDPEKLEEISEAITREEIRQLIKDGAIEKKQKKGVSRARVRARKRKKRGVGSRKGGKYSRLSRKEQWMRRVRAQRKRLRELRDRGLVTKTVYRRIYRMVKAGAFKSVAAMMEYLEQNKLIRRPLL